MAKEHLIEPYGTLRYTIGTGCSGGSLVQQQVANAYPGIYQGILPQCSFPDSWSTGQQLAAYHFDRGYFEDPKKWGTGIVWTPTQIAAVEGHPNHVNAIVFDTRLLDLARRPVRRLRRASRAPTTTTPRPIPDGVRCTLADYMVNVWARAPPSVGPGRAAARPWVRRPADRRRRRPVRARRARERRHHARAVRRPEPEDRRRRHRPEPDPAAQRRHPARAGNVYRSGGVNETNNLTGVAIIDLRGPDPGAFHDAYRSWAIRARLEQAEGHFPHNRGDLVRRDAADRRPQLHDPGAEGDGPLAVGASSATTATCRSPTKVSQDRPTDVHDQCSDDPRRREGRVPGVGPVCSCARADALRHPRDGRGREHRHRPEACQLKPLRAATTTRSRSPTTSGRRFSRRSPRGLRLEQARRRPAGRRSRGRPTSSATAASSTAASRSGRRPPDPAAAGPAARSPPGATQAADAMPRRRAITAVAAPWGPQRARARSRRPPWPGSPAPSVTAWASARTSRCRWTTAPCCGRTSTTRPTPRRAGPPTASSP